MPVPAGRDQITRALVRACEQLCGEHPPSMVSVRDIAARARVTPGLVHHYFASKDALVAATLDAIASDIDATAAAALAQTGDAGEMVRAVWHFLQQRPAFASIVAWWLVEGRDVTAAMGDHPFLRRLVVALGGPTDPQAASTAATVVVGLIGGTVFNHGLNRALGRPLDDPGLTEALEANIVDLSRRSAKDAPRPR